MLPSYVLYFEYFSMAVYVFLIFFLLFTRNKALRSPFFTIFISTGGFLFYDVFLIFLCWTMTEKL